MKRAHTASTPQAIVLPAGPGQIGVDIGDRWICVAQLVGRGEQQRPHLSGALKLARTHEGIIRASEVQQLREAILRAGLALRPVVINAPDASLFSATLELPPRASGAPLEQLARLEVSRTHRIDPESFEMALWDLPTPERSKNMTLAMCAALPRQAVTDTLAAFDDAGVSVAAIDTRSCALARIATMLAGDQGGGLIGVVEMGWSATHVTLLHLGVATSPTLVYERRIDEVSVRSIVRTLQDRLGIDDRAAELSLRMGDEDDVDHTLVDLMRSVRRYQSEFIDLLVPDVQRSFLYASQRYPTLPLIKVLMTGEGAGVRGLRARLASALSVETVVAQAQDFLDAAPESTFSKDACIATAAGLAMHAGVVRSPDELRRSA